MAMTCGLYSSEYEKYVLWMIADRDHTNGPQIFGQFDTMIEYLSNMYDGNVDNIRNLSLCGVTNNRK